MRGVALALLLLLCGGAPLLLAGTSHKPKSSWSSGTKEKKVHVKGYYRKDGTYWLHTIVPPRERRRHRAARARRR
jgi:hypothetical protein